MAFRGWLELFSAHVEEVAFSVLMKNIAIKPGFLRFKVKGALLTFSVQFKLPFL